MIQRLDVGPFAESIEAIEKFGTNVYMNYLYGETIEQLLEAERELDVAKKFESTESENYISRVYSFLSHKKLSKFTGSSLPR